LITSCRILTNMGLRKEFQAVSDRTVHARLITLLQWKNLCRAKRISRRHTVRFVRQQERLASIVPAYIRIIRKDLALKCIKKKQAQDLTDANKKARLVRTRQLLRRCPDHMVKFIWFSGEKLFSVATPVNAQNDRLYVPTGTKKRDVNATHLLKTRLNFSKSVMVSIAVSSLGASNIHMLEPGVKINGAYYCDVVLRQMRLPDIRAASGSEFFVFQQDSAPPQRAKDTVALLDQETPDFITPDVWSPN